MYQNVYTFGKMAPMSRKPHEVLATREAREQLPTLLAAFRAEGANAEPVVIGARRRPEGVVLSYERYLQLLEGRDRVRTILSERATQPSMDEDEALRLAVAEQHAARR
jgi:PHD/YefM family antitoxin component YafN of YafNO toxin-antitoxin module